MSRPEDREPSPGGSADDDLAARGVLVVLALAVLPLAAGWLVARPAARHRWGWRRTGWRGARGLVLSGVACVLGLVALGTIVPVAGANWHHDPTATVVTVALGLWLALAPLAWGAFRWRSARTATALEAGTLPPHTADRTRRAIREAADADAYARVGWTLREGAPAPLLPRRQPVTVGGRPVLGVVVQDDRRDVLTRWADSTGRRSRAGHPWVTGDRLTLPESPPRAVILGDSGSGKTTLSAALTLGALREGWRVLYLDGKGNPDDAAALVGLARVLGLPVVEYPRQPFDLWRGDGATLARLAAALLPHDGAQHYRDRDAGTLAAVGALTGWRSSDDLLARLRTPAPHVTRDALPALVHRSDGSPAHMATYAAMTAALAPLAGCIDPTGWHLDDDPEGWRLAVVSLDAGANPSAPVMGAAMLAALDAYRVGRSPTAPPLLVVVDEAGVLLDHPAAPPVARLAEQLRSAGVGLVLAGQSPHSLGEQADRILSSGAALVTLRSAEPEAVVQRIGTTRAAEVAHQSAGGSLTGVTAAREQAQYALDPDRVRSLPPWRVALWQPGWSVVHGVVPPTSHPLDPR